MNIWKSYYYLHRSINWLSHKYYKSIITGATDDLIIKGRIRITYPQNVEIGHNCSINEEVYINAVGGVRLGNSVTLSTGSKILTRSYDVRNWYEQCQKTEPEMAHVEKQVYLADHTWIGAGAIILPGVEIIGKGVIIAAGSVVTKSIIEDYVLYAGTPARKIKKYTKDEENESL